VKNNKQFIPSTLQEITICKANRGLLIANMLETIDD
jgi:hypothetical protein